MKHFWKISILMSLVCLWLAACAAPEVEVTAVLPARTLAPTETMTVTAVPPTTMPMETTTPTPTLLPTETATAMPTVTPPIGQIITPSEIEIEQEVKLEVVNQMGGAVTAVAVQDNLAYLGIGSRLAVADVSDPTKPNVISWSGVLPGVAEQIILRDDLAYVALGEAGLWIFDISDPLALKPVGHVQTTNPVRHFLLQDNRAYVVDTNGPLEAEQFLSIVDVSEPTRPNEVGTYLLPVRANRLALVDGYLYVSLYRDANFEDTLLILDVSNPASPVLVTAVPDLGGRDIAVNEKLLFTSDPWGRMKISDISDPLNPITIIENSDLIEYGGAGDIYLNQDVLWMVNPQSDGGDCIGNVVAFDVSQPRNIRRADGVRSGCVYNDMVVVDGVIYLATNNSLYIADATSKGVGAYRGELLTTPPLYQLAIDEDLYGSGTFGNHHNIYSFSLREPTHPQMVGVYESEYSINDIVTAGSQLYLATYWQGIAAIDMTDPINPQETAVTSSEYHAENSNNLVLSDNRLYASLNGNLGIFDPITLQWIGGDGEELYGHYNSFVVENNTLWTWMGGYELLALDVIDPEQFEELGVLSQEERGQLWVADRGFIYYLTGRYCDPKGCYGEYALRVVDATNPNQMRTVATLPTAPEIDSVVLSGNLLVLVGDDIWLVDVSDPTQPHFVGYFPTPGYSRDAVVLDDLIYVADGAGGLLVLRLVE